MLTHVSYSSNSLKKMQSTTIIWYRLLISLLALPSMYDAAETGCIAIKFSQESIVCVCNSKRCDNFERPGPFEENGFLQYITTKIGNRLTTWHGMFSFYDPAGPKRIPAVADVIVPEPTITYQEVLGFGGAMTDAAGYNIASLSSETQKKLLGQYFGEDGIDYTFLRIPIGGSDFSTHNYTYLDVQDESLQNFNLTNDDFAYKFPYIKMAQQMSRSPIKLFASAWSPPEWMKEQRNATLGYTRLKRQYYQLWADYYIKFFGEYKKQGVEFWGLTAQNEPFHGRDVYFGFNSVGWDSFEMRDWIANYLGPTLERNGYGHLKLIMLDDLRIFLPEWPDAVMENEKARKYISGIGVHWYDDFKEIPKRDPDLTLSVTHNMFPDKFLLYTESSNIPNAPKGTNGVKLGNWENAERYATNIIEDMNHWVTGWVDWNMALDMEGGPNWVSSFVDSPIIVNAKRDEFYKQPMFYALAHFSKFVPPGSRRIELRLVTRVVETVGFLTPDNTIAIVVLNRKDKAVDVFVKVTDAAYIIINCPEHSMHTVLYNATSHKDMVKTTRTSPHFKPRYGYNGQEYGHNELGFGNNVQRSGRIEYGFVYDDQGSGHIGQGFRYNGRGPGPNGQAFGYDGQGSGHIARGFAYNSQGSGHNAQGFRYNGQGSGQNGQRFGYDGQESGHNGQGFGYDGQESGHNGQGFGYDAQGSGHIAQGFGYDSQESGYTGQGFGYDTRASGHNGQGFGKNDHGYGYYGPGNRYFMLPRRYPFQ